MERELWRWDAVELAASIRSRKISSREAVQSVLRRLDAVNPALGPAPQRLIRVALSVDPSKQGVHPDVAAAVRAAGVALSEAGYTVEEVDPPDVAGVADCWGALIGSETRHVTLPSILKHGDAGVIRSMQLMLELSVDADLEGYMKLLYREDLCLDAAEVIEAQRGLTTPINPAR